MPRKLNVFLPLTGAILLVAVAWTCRNTLYDAPMVYQAQSLKADLSVRLCWLDTAAGVCCNLSVGVGGQEGVYAADDGNAQQQGPFGVNGSWSGSRVWSEYSPIGPVRCRYPRLSCSMTRSLQQMPRVS